MPRTPTVTASPPGAPAAEPPSLPALWAGTLPLLTLALVAGGAAGALLFTSDYILGAPPASAATPACSPSAS